MKEDFEKQFENMKNENKKTLTEEDLWAPNPRDVTRRNAPRFIETWEADAAKAEVKGRRKEGLRTMIFA